MLTRFITQADAQGVFETIGPAELRLWMANFPANAARRMTRLGLLLGHALREFHVEAEDAVVFATTFAEALTTERYLASFPAASPLFFQTSIHPSAIEQVLINRGFPVRELTPLAGRERLGAQAMVSALLTPAPRVFLTGGEELGTWLGDIGASSPTAFAFALRLDREPAGALGEISWSPTAAGETTDGTAASQDLRALFDAVRERGARRWPAPSGGELGLTWYGGGTANV